MLERQVYYSNLAIINKIDLIDKERIQDVHQEVLKIHPTVKLHETSFGEIPFDFLNEDIIGDYKPEAQETTNSKDNKPKTLSLSWEGCIPQEKLNKFLDGVSPQAFRIKGFAHLDEGQHKVDVVNQKVDIVADEHGHELSTLVFISKVGIQIIKQIDTAWKSEIGVPMKMKN